MCGVCVVGVGGVVWWCVCGVGGWVVLVCMCGVWVVCVCGACVWCDMFVCGVCMSATYSLHAML